MRYDKLSSTILLSCDDDQGCKLQKGFTEEQWKEGQSRTVSLLINQPADESTPHAEAANQYEQMVNRFKETLLLWPW